MRPVLALTLMATAAAASERDAAESRIIPNGVIDPRTVVRTVHDGEQDDLLTAGLGLDGLRSPAPPGFVDPSQPTAQELRRRATWQNYRALIDLSPTGGAGRDFGPRPGERVPGVEYAGTIRDPTGGAPRHTVLLQIPRAFDVRNPCLVAVAASGSRGIRGALPTAAEWGLRRGCAVVHTDKGAGTGFFDVRAGRIVHIDGTTGTDSDDPRASFAPVRGAALERLRSGPLRDAVLVRHADAGTNIERDWGAALVEATRTAFAWLNDEYGRAPRERFEPANTLVIAAGLSNGGGAVLRALELDTGSRDARWFDGAVAAEPSIQVRGASRSLYDYASLAQLLQPCAVLAEREADAPLDSAVAGPREQLAAWCADLAAAGEVAGTTLEAQATDARRQLRAAGFGPESLALGALNLQLRLWASVAATYAAAHSRAEPGAMPCGFGYAFVDAGGSPRGATDEEWAWVFADSNGIPPTAGIALLRSAGGPYSVAAAYSPDAARCLRRLFAGTDEASARLARGIAELSIDAQPGERPVVILHGRADSLVLPAHTSRAYLAAAYASTRAARTLRDLRYYELEHAQHFDAALALPALGARYVPMQPWFVAAIDSVYTRLVDARPLPPSQVIRARPRGAAGLIPVNPSPPDLIAVRDGRLHVPE
jgi:hydroxybutyrate-dimer hydrolase